MLAATGCLWIVLGSMIGVGAILVAGASVDSGWTVFWVVPMLVLGIWLLVRPHSLLARLLSAALVVVSGAIIGVSYARAPDHDHSFNALILMFLIAIVLLTVGGWLREIRLARQD